MSQDNLREPGKGFVKRTLTVLGLLAFVALFLLAAWRVQSVVFLLFLGVLLAVFWRGLSRPVACVTSLPSAWAVGVVIVVLGALSALLGWFFVPPLVEQTQGLIEAVPEALGALETALRGTPLGVSLREGMPEMSEVPEAAMSDTLLPRLTEFVGGLANQLLGTVAATAAVITDLVFLFFSALFFALNPEFYRRGLVSLVPKGRRARFDEVLRVSGDTLWSWLLGRLVAMLSVGVMVTLGLWALGVPLALLLGFLAFLLDFVPYLGPFVSAVPALLLAFTVSPLTVVWVALLYLVVQQLESYVVTPIVQQRAVELPPVLTLVAVFVFGGLFGLLGLLVATPLMAVILVFIRTLYLEDVLGDAPDDAGGEDGSADKDDQADTGDNGDSKTAAKRPILVRRRNV